MGRKHRAGSATSRRTGGIPGKSDRGAARIGAAEPAKSAGRPAKTAECGKYCLGKKIVNTS